MQKKTIAAHTLGCKVNQYDTQAMLEIFQNDGYEVVDFTDYADIYLVNTCTVTAIADKKSRQFLSQARKRNNEAIIIATGCYSQRMKDEILKYCNLAIGTDNRGEVLRLVEEYKSSNTSSTSFLKDNHIYEPLFVSKQVGHTRPHMKIQEGCNNSCAYCIIPSVRGDIRSRELEHIKHEAIDLYNSGVQEVVLTGINISSYGLDQASKPNLYDVVSVIEDCRIPRIRLGSIDPGTFLSIPKLLTDTNRLCPHFHLSLQSGCDNTLKAMNRWYNTDKYREEVEYIRSYLPDCSITTDIIVGFPNESDDDFQSTYDFIESIEFAKIHLFPFSSRPNTAAETMSNQISNAIKKKRIKKLAELGDMLEQKYIDKFINNDLSVLFERQADGHNTGYSTEYINVNTSANVSLKNQVHSVHITHSENKELFGKLNDHK